MSSINANATVTLTVNGKQAQDMLDNLKKKSQDLEKAIEGAAKAGDKAKLTRLQKELRQTNRQIAQIESATVGVEKVLKNLDKATPKELNKTLSTLRSQLNGIERGTEGWNRQCEAIKRVKAEIARVNADLAVGEGFWDRFNRKMNEWQTTLMGMAAAITGLIMAGRSAVKAFADMDAEMANVRKFTGMTKEQVEDLNEEFKKMNTRTSREQLNILAEEAGKLGKTSKEDILGFVTAADQINVALDELGDGATLTLSKLTTIFGDEKRLGTEKALLSVGSVINELSQNCTAAAPYLANFAKRMAGVGAQAEMTIPQIMGLAAVLDSQGQAVEMSATAVSKLIMDMFKQQDKVIKATGMNAEKFKEALARGTNEGLLMLLDTLHQLGNIDVLAPVFKDMGENGARAAQVISALAGNLDMIRWEQEEAAKAFEEATSVTKEYDVQNNTVQAGLDKARKRVNELAVELGEKLQPVMQHVISSTTLLLRFMSTTISFFINYKEEIAATAAVWTGYAIAVNYATVKMKLAAAAHAAWNIVIKTANVLMPIAQVLINGMRLAIEKYVLHTKRATTAQIAYNRSLVTLRNNALAAKTAYGLIAVAVTALVVALVRYAKQQTAEAKALRMLNDIRSEAAQKVADEKVKIDLLVQAAQNEKLSLDERKKAIDKLNSIIPNYNAQLDTTSGKYKANKQALDEYVKSLVKMYEIMGAKDKLKELGAQKADLMIKKSEAEENVRKKQSGVALSHYDVTYTQSGSRLGTPGMRMMAQNVNSGENRARSALAQAQSELNDIIEDLDEIALKEKQITDIWGEDLQKSEASEPEEPQVTEPETPTVTTPTDTGNKEERFKEEKAWKAREEALNRIAYATGQKNYEEYQQRILAIEQEYQQKILERDDLTEQERLDAQAAFYEAKRKIVEDGEKRTVEQENVSYSEAVAMQKQRYIDGEIDQETYQQTLEQLELNHLRRMVSLYREGTSEYRQAIQAYQDRMLADQQKRQQEAEAAEKKHQDRLAQIKKDYFGDNRGERVNKYMADLEALKQVYELEIQAAGDNAREKLRIEEAYQKAKKALRKQYGIDELDDNKIFLEEWTEDMQEWLQSDMGKAVTGSLEVISSGMSSIFQQLSSLVQAECDIQVAAIEKRYKTEISNAEGNNYQVKKLEAQKEKEIAKVKNEANKKMYKMQVMQAIAQTATAALNAYSSAAAVPVIGYILAPIAAATAVAAGLLQVEAIKKQQEASQAQGYASGGFTGDGGKYEVAGVVHKGEWVATQELLHSPVARPMIEALDYAQRTNTIGSLRSDDVSRTIVAPSVYTQSAQSTPTVIVQQPGSDAQTEIAATHAAMKEYADVIRQLKDRLNEPFVTVNTVTGDTGIKQAQDEYEQLMRNKTPKSRRS
jgi:TP901 family phage tail tape measure protein